MKTFLDVPVFTFFYTTDGQRWFKRSTKTAQSAPLNSDEKTPSLYFKTNTEVV